MSTAIIFGATGQTGHYLAASLTAIGMSVVKVSRRNSDRDMDVADFDDVERLIKEQRPEMIFHLAARSTTRHDAVLENHSSISTGAINVLEAARRHATNARIFITGSGVQFVNDGQPINEQTPFDPSSPYAVARIHSVYAARYYRKLNQKVYVGYLFHHESPLRPPGHVSQKIATAVGAIAAGKKVELELGDLTVAKEWTFAGDVAEGILVLMNQDAIYEAVIGSGIAHTIEQWVAACFTAAKLEWRDHVRIIPGFRPEYRVLVSDPRRILSLGWKPRMSMPQLAALMVDAAGNAT